MLVCTQVKKKSQRRYREREAQEVEMSSENSIPADGTTSTADRALLRSSMIRKDGQSRHYFKGRRKRFLFFASYTLLSIVLLELVLLNPNLRPVEAGKKKKIIKKIKEILPLVALLKRKKIILLPIPM